MKKQHPIAILQYTTKNFWLLLIPLLRGLFSLSDFEQWLEGAYLDILVLAAMIGLAVLRWWFIRFDFGADGVKYVGGLAIKRVFTIPYGVITSLTAKHPMALRPLGAVKLYIDTDTQSVLNKLSEPDVKLVVRKADYDGLQSMLPESVNAKKTYTSPKGKLFLFSLLFSSTLSGLIYFGTLVIQGGRMVGNELEERFVTAVNDVTSIAGQVIKGVTPISVGFIMLLAAGWLYSFITNYLRHINFRITRCAELITVRSGFFSRWDYRISTDKINYADLRQNLLMKLCGVMSVHVSCSGYGKEKNAIPVFVPITPQKSVIGVMRLLLPEFRLSKTDYNPRWSYIMRFLGIPTAMIFAVMLGGFAATLFFPDWYSVILFACIMGEILSFHLLFVKLMSYYTNGVSFRGNVLTLAYCNLFQFHNVIVPLDKIAYVGINRTFFQRMSDACDLVVYTKSETVKRHTVKGLRLDDALEIAAQTGFTKNEFGGRLEN